MTPRKSTQIGFTLVEMAVVVFLIGILATMGIAAANAVIAASAISDTKKKEETIKDALVAYLSRNKRLPCPAVDSGGSESWVSGSPRTCTGPFGILPYAELGLPRSAALDGWENMFSYGVSPQWTTAYSTTAPVLNGTYTNVPASSFNSGLTGTLTLNNRLQDGSIVTTTAAAIVISHGKDGLGAFTTKGTKNAVPTLDQLANVSASPWATPAAFFQREFTDNAGATGGVFDDVVYPMTQNDLIVPAVRDGAIKSAPSQWFEQTNNIKNIVFDRVLTDCNVLTDVQLGSSLNGPYGEVAGYTRNVNVISYALFVSNPALASTPVYTLTDGFAIPIPPNTLQGPTVGTLFGAYPFLQTRCP